jgi:hypothetical protein
MYWVPGHARLQGNEIADKLARDDSVQRFVGPEPFLGVSRQNIRKTRDWLENQHLVLWHGPCSTQRQARELTSGPDLATRAQLLSFNRTLPRVVIGLLTGHNTLRKCTNTHTHTYIYIYNGLSNNPICRKCGIQEETSVHILCECEALASLIHTWVPSFWTLGIVGNYIEGPSGTLPKEKGFSNLVQNMGHKGPVLRPRCIGPERLKPKYHSIQFNEHNYMVVKFV